MIKYKYFLAFSLLLILVSGFFQMTFAQPGDPGGDPDVPITGIEWLLVGGGLFGIRKLYKRVKKA